MGIPAFSMGGGGGGGEGVLRKAGCALVKQIGKGGGLRHSAGSQFFCFVLGFVCFFFLNFDLIEALPPTSCLRLPTPHFSSHLSPDIPLFTELCYSQPRNSECCPQIHTWPDVLRRAS